MFAELVRNSRRTATQHTAPLKGGAQLVVLVRDGWLTLTIKRPGAPWAKPVGAREIETFRRDCHVPADAEILTPIEPHVQLARTVATTIDADGEVDVLWFYVAFRWEDSR